MANRETTTKFRVDISELKANIQEANRQIALANSEFKKASAGMEKWSDDADGLSAKIEQLKTVTSQYETILGELEGQYEKVVKEQGENSQGATDLKIKINSLEGAIIQNNTAIGKYEDQLSDMTSESKDSKTAMDKLNDTISDQEDDLAKLKKKYSNLVTEQGKSSKEAKDTAKEIEKLSKELKENKSKVGDAEKAADKFDQTLDDLGDAAKDAEGGFTVLKGALSTFGGNILTGVANGIRDIGSSILGLGESTREYRGLMNKLDAAAKDGGYAADFTKEKYTELYGVLGDETAAQTTISNFMAMGASEEELNSLINASTGIWAKYGDSIPLDGLAESINETKKVGQVTGGLADALNWAGISEDDFNEKLEKCSNEQERQQLIIDTLNGTYGSLADTYKETNKDVIEANEANARYQDTLSKVGEKVEPVTTAMKNGFSGLLEKALELVDGVDITAFTDKISEGFTYISDTVFPAVVSGFQWILDNKDAVIAGLAGIGTAFLAFKVVTLIQSVTSALKGMSIAQAALNLVMSMNPIGLVVAAIAGLVAAFVVLWNKSEGFREFWIGLWEKIKGAVSPVVDSIVNFFTVTVPEAFNSFVGFLGEFINSVVEFFSELPGKIWGFLSQVISDVGTWASDMWEKAKETGSNFIDSIVTFFTQLPGKVWGFLSDVISKAATWLLRMTQKAKETGERFLDKIVEFFTQLPGKVWGFLSDTISKATTWVSDMKDKAKEAASGFVDKVVEFVTDLPGKVKGYLDDVISKLTSWVSDMGSKGTEGAKKLFDNVVDGITGLPEKIKGIGGDVVEGLWNGIKDMGSWISEKISGFGDGVLSSLKNFFGIKSPSRLMRDEIGKYIPMGVAEGIARHTRSAVNAVKNMGAAMVPVSDDIRSAVSGGVRNTASTLRGGKQGATTINFYQTNNSPKSLNRLEIYKQTRNQLRQLKGGVVYA